MSDELRPEELWQGLSQSSRDVFSEDRIVDFLEDWSESEAFVEDLSFVVGGVRPSVRPEEVFEHLASSSNYYTVEEILEMSEEVSDHDWSREPEISGTGEAVSLELGDKCLVPGEEDFFDLPEDYFGRTELKDGEKHIWLNQHEDFYQIGVSPFSIDELEEVFTGFEALAPSQCFHEAEYGDMVYNLNSEDLSYFFMFEDEIESFDSELYRIESVYDNFSVEYSKIPNESSYEVSVFCWRTTENPINALNSVLSSKVISGLKTKLMMQYLDET